MKANFYNKKVTVRQSLKKESKFFRCKLKSDMKL